MEFRLKKNPNVPFGWNRCMDALKSEEKLERNAESIRTRTESSVNDVIIITFRHNLRLSLLLKGIELDVYYITIREITFDSNSECSILKKQNILAIKDGDSTRHVDSASYCCAELT